MALANTPMVFNNAPIVNGDGTAGTTALWEDVAIVNGTAVDVVGRIISIGAGATITFATSGDDAQAQLIYGSASGNLNAFVDYEFYEANTFGTASPVPIELIPSAVFKDIDQTQTEAVAALESDIASYTLENPTSLVPGSTSGYLYFTSTRDGVAADTDLAVQIDFNAGTKIGVVYASSGGNRFFDLDGDLDLVFSNPQKTAFDTTPPVNPTVDSQLTNDPTPVITGTAEATTTLTVVVAGATYTVIAESDGTWSLDTGAVTPDSGTFAPNTNGFNEVAVTSTDAAGNSSSDTSNNELEIDTTAPTVDIQGEPTQTNAPYSVTFEFSEDVTGFVVGDISAGNATLSDFTAVDANTYTATVTPTSDGTVTLDVPANGAQDAAGNGNTAATQATTTYDATKPGVSISAPSDTNAAFTATFEFSEDVTGFAVGDITASNATLSNFTAVDGNTYTATVTPTSEGPVTLDVAADVAQDAATNTNTAASQAVTNYDITVPTVAIQNVPANSNAPFTATFEFSEDVVNFTQGDITAGNATLSGFTAVDGNTYTALVTPTSDGTVTLDVPANGAQDAAGNNNTAATQASSEYDATPPTVAIQNVPADTNAAFTATFEFSEDVTGFTQSDITASNATLSDFTAVDGNTYTATVTPTSEGAFTLDVPANGAQDVAGNNNTAATQAGGNFDTTAPTVVIQNVPADTNAAFTATFEFSEDVTGFAVGDITASNATLSNFTAVDGNTYTATVTPTSEGAFTLDVSANGAQDAAGNNNTAATQVGGDFDTTSPDVAFLNVPTATNGNFDVTVEFSEDVTGFNAADVVVTNASVASVTAVDGNTYTVSVVADGNGTVTLDINANIATDAAGNGNTAAAQASVNYDPTIPSVQIQNVPDDTNAAFTATFAFSEDMTGFDITDISASNASLSNFTAVDAATYTATVTPDSEGSFSLAVAAGVAQDLAGNDNTAATTVSGNYDVTAPQAQINGAPTVVNNTDPFVVTLAFSEVMQGVTSGDLLVQNGSVSSFSSSDNQTWTVEITPDGVGNIALDLPANSAQDAAANGNTAASSVLVVLDSDGDGIDDETEGTGDTDGDGIPDYLDTSNDEDGDGVPDAIEGALDSDGDGINDALEADADNDGIPDGVEVGILSRDSDADGIDDRFDVDQTGGTDANGDGVDDAVAAIDTDGDGIADFRDTDSDNDGVPDRIEAAVSNLDSDGDGIDDRFDVDQTGGVDANNDGVDDSVVVVDSDGDGLADNRDADADNDGLPDPLEAQLSFVDTDADGIDDTFDVDQTGGVDANNDGIDDAFSLPDQDADGTANLRSGDSDSDGVADQLEVAASGLDSDADGIDDSFDVDQTGGLDANNDGIDDSAVALDTDNDGVPDYLDLDSDNDSINDIVEAGLDDTDHNGLLDDGDLATLSERDSDDDGIADRIDTDSNNDGVNDIAATSFARLDADQDGVIDNATAADNADADGDGIPDLTDGDQGVLGTDRDYDGDGIPNPLDPDNDNDGLSDVQEGALSNGAASLIDSDGDGITDDNDLDSDNDGLPDWQEASGVAPSGTDTDADGIDDAYDIDQTGGVDSGAGTGAIGGGAGDDAGAADGIDDAVQSRRDSDNDGAIDALDADSDNDGLSDGTEANLSAASGSDSDNDGVDDAFDSANNPAFVDSGTGNGPGNGSDDLNGDGIADATLVDTDGDSLADLRDNDSDNDGITDDLEGSGDSDNDSVADYRDSLLDEDFDGIPDIVEGSNDSDANNQLNAFDVDVDNDGIPDALESGLASTDSDNDGIIDAFDVDQTGGLDGNGDGIDDAFATALANNSLLLDSDDDGIIDLIDADSDNDGIPDALEAGLSGLDSDNDGIDDAYDVDQTGGVDANGDGIDDQRRLPDSDGDGIADVRDNDSDNDGVPDLLESGFANAAGELIDSDGDGIADVIDVDNTLGTDANGDGIDDLAALADSDGDGVADYLDLDSDNDSINDVVEAGLEDADNDGLADVAGTLVTSALDSDGDGVADRIDLDSDNDGSFDIQNGLYRNADSDGDGRIDLITDFDGDGIADVVDAEPASHGTTLDSDGDGIANHLDSDDDNDGISDLLEGNLDSDGDGIVDRLDRDSDGDGVPDSVEAGLTLSGIDSDGDGIDDAIDVDLIGGDDLDGDGISDALSLRDTDGDGIPDALDTDSDGDGIDDWQEIFGFAPTGFDSDGDGIDDAIDVDQVGGEDLNGDGIADALMNLSDLDGDGLPAYLDSDADGDGLSDGVELGDYDGDGIPDNEQSPSEIETALSGSGAGYKGLGLLLLAAVVAGVYRRTHPKGKHHNGHHKSSHGPIHGNQGHSSQSQNKQSQIQKGSDKGTSE